MSIESKLDALSSAVAAVATAVQNIPGANTQALTDAVAAVKSELDGVAATIGTEAAPVTAPSTTAAV